MHAKNTWDYYNHVSWPSILFFGPYSINSNSKKKTTIEPVVFFRNK